MEAQIILHAYDLIDQVEPGTYGCDLHHKLFNEDYFIIGYYSAEKFLKTCEYGIFGAINLIAEYEKGNFGEVTTDFSDSEKVANMYAYIRGEELLNEIKLLTKKWDEGLTLRDLHEIKEILDVMARETE